MGAEYVVERAAGGSSAEALSSLLSTLRERFPNWDDPHLKGCVQVWSDPVPDDATCWMTGYTRQHPPKGVDPEDKWGPWMAFPLADGRWCLHGWVNT